MRCSARCRMESCSAGSRGGRPNTAGRRPNSGRARTRIAAGGTEPGAAFPVVQVEEHGRALRGRDQEILELSHPLRTYVVLDAIGRAEPVRALGNVDVDEIG